MSRKLWWMGVCSTLLAVGAVIGITAGCGKGKETAVGTNAAPTAGQCTTDAGPVGHWEADITGDGPQRIGVTVDVEHS